MSQWKTHAMKWRELTYKYRQALLETEKELKELKAKFEKETN